MRRILTSLLVIGVVAAAGVGASRAYFTDTETSDANTLTTGTLVLDVNNNGSTGTFDMDMGSVTSLVPGDTTDEVTLLIRNTGTTNFAWFGYFMVGNVSNDLDKAIYFDTAQMEFLKDDLTTSWETTDPFITNGTGTGPYPTHYIALANSDPFDVISLRTFNSSANNMMGAGPGVFMGALKPGYTYRLTFSLGMAPMAGSSYQGGSLDLSFRAVATQIDEDAVNAISTTNSVVEFPSSVADDHVVWFNNQIANQTE